MSDKSTSFLLESYGGQGAWDGIMDQLYYFQLLTVKGQGGPTPLTGQDNSSKCYKNPAARSLKTKFLRCKVGLDQVHVM